MTAHRDLAEPRVVLPQRTPTADDNSESWQAEKSNGFYRNDQVKPQTPTQTFQSIFTKLT